MTRPFGEHLFDLGDSKLESPLDSVPQALLVDLLNDVHMNPA
jgi:hypothetical protein